MYIFYTHKKEKACNLDRCLVFNLSKFPSCNPSTYLIKWQQRSGSFQTVASHLQFWHCMYWKHRANPYVYIHSMFIFSWLYFKMNLLALTYTSITLLEVLVITFSTDSSLSNIYSRGDTIINKHFTLYKSCFLVIMF